MLETKRLILRNLESSKQDMQALYSLLSDKEVNEFLPIFPMKSLADTEEYFHNRILNKYESNSGLYLAICLKENNIPIGYITIGNAPNHDFGYGLRKEYWNQEIVTEAASAVISHLENSGYHFITATHDVNNIGSGKVMEKLGMEYQYSYKELWQPKNFWVTFRMYQLNFTTDADFVYREYWNKYPEHFVENI